jgi:hypothetical protein
MGCCHSVTPPTNDPPVQLGGAAVAAAADDDCATVLTTAAPLRVWFAVSPAEGNGRRGTKLVPRLHVSPACSLADSDPNWGGQSAATARDSDGSSTPESAEEFIFIEW